MSAEELRRYREQEQQARRVRRGWEAALGGRFSLAAPLGARTVGGVQQNPVATGPTSGGGGGAVVALFAATDQTIEPGGTALEVSAINPDVRHAGFSPVLPGAELFVPYSAVVSVLVRFRWTEWRAGGSVKLMRDDTMVDQALTGWGTRFEGVLHAGVVRPGEALTVVVDHLDGSDHDVTGVRLTPKIEGPAEGVVLDAAEPGLYVVAHYLNVLNVTKVKVSGASVLASATLSGVGDFRNIRAEIIGDRIRAKAWNNGDSEPGAWQLDVTDPDPLPAGFAGVTTPIDGGGSYIYDDFEVDIDGSPSSTDFSGYTTGAGIPTGWAIIYGEGASGWSIVADGGYSGGKYLGNTGGGSFLAWTAAGSGDDTQVYALGLTVDRTLGVIMRAQDINP